MNETLPTINEALSTIARTAAAIEDELPAVAHALSFTSTVLHNRDAEGDHRVVQALANEMAELQATLIMGAACTKDGNAIARPVVTPTSRERIGCLAILKREGTVEYAVR